MKVKILASIDKEVDDQFRKNLFEKFGYGKGHISRVIGKLIENWNDDYEQKRIS